MQHATIFNVETRASRICSPELAEVIVRGSRGLWSFAAPPPENWAHQIPRYRASRTVHPSPNKRFRFEAPLAYILDSDEWQQGDRIVQAGEEIETKEWPHQSFRGLNYAAERVLKFFNERQKSRLAFSPWRGNCVFLDDGLTGTAPKVFRPALPRAAEPTPVCVAR